MGEEGISEIDRAISALQDRTRRRILLDFYVHQPEWTVDDVARAAGVHRTVAHGHLARLVALGYLAVGRRRGKFGKPANLYRLAGRQIDFTFPARRFASLAGLLAEGLQTRGREGVEAARQAGRRYGASLVSKPHDSPQSVLHELAPLGAEYVIADDGRLIARNCIFRQACAAAGDIVCELHAGLLEGAFQQAGMTVRTEALGNYAEWGCAYQVLTT